MRSILFLFLALVAAACVSVDYVGKSYPATSHVEIYFSESDIQRPYELMGELIAETDDMVFTNGEKMQNKLVEEAKKKGADGIILSSLERRVTGEASSASSETKVSSDKVRTTERSESSVKEKKELRARLIKFKN
jgi:uncharacterized protein YbjQ (UPF0145 family)